MTLLALAFTAFVAAAGPPSAPTPERAGEPPMPTSMLDRLAAWCDLLCRDGVTLREVAAALGPLPSEGAIRTVHPPAWVGVSEARLEPAPGSDAPLFVDLDLAAPLPLAALRARFGAGVDDPPHEPFGPYVVLFDPARSGAKWTCALVVTVTKGARGLEDATVSHLTLRRDERLP